MLARWVVRACALALVATTASAGIGAARTLPLDGRSVFRFYGAEDGLLNVTVECLLQDHSGYLWIGTQDGLFRLEGKRFHRFGREQGLPSSRIRALHETADRHFYAATRDGLALFDGDRFRPVSEVSSPLGAESVASLGRSLFVATVGGLMVGERRGWHLEFPPGLSEKSVSAVHVAPDGSLFYSAHGLLFRRSNGQTSDFGTARSLPAGESIDAILTDGDGALWARTLDRLYVLRANSQRFEEIDEGLPRAVGSGRLGLDRSGRILVPTENGLAQRVGNEWRLIGRTQGLASDTVQAALVDREGSLWIGLAGGGLAQRLGSGDFMAWGEDEGLSHDVVWSIARDGDRKALWVGTEDGVDRVDSSDRSIVTFDANRGLRGNTAYAVISAADGGVWVGMWPGGVAHIDSSGRAIANYDAVGLAPADFKVAALHRSEDGSIWAGTRMGVYRMAPPERTFSQVTVSGGEAPDSVFAFAETADGTLFGAGRFGLLRLTGDVRRWRRKDGLEADFLASATALRDGSLVIGYREALGAANVRASGSRILVTPLSGPLPAKVLFAGSGADGALWLGGDAGVDVRSSDELHWHHYGRADGLITEDTDQNAFFSEADGSIWFGTGRGLVHYAAGTAEVTAVAPPIFLIDAMAGKRRLDLRSPVRLSRDERSVTFHWAGLTYIEPSRVRFRYRLVGLEETPTETSQQEVRYPALPTGLYRFEVSAISAAGVPSEQPAAIVLSIEPAWWERWWSRGAAGLVLILILFGIVWYRTRFLDLERKRLEMAVEERSAELAHKNRELEQLAVTDPLTGVSNRRFFNATIAGEASLAIRAHADSKGQELHNRDLVFYTIDLDHFKQVNDQYGHAAGDAVLVEAARRLGTLKRVSDYLIRWGGEEFLLISRETSRASAGVVAGRILESIGGKLFDARGNPLRLTCSVGWAAFPVHGRDIDYETVLRLSDRALYKAKASGRNCAIGMEPVPGIGTFDAESVEIRIERVDGPAAGSA